MSGVQLKYFICGFSGCGKTTKLNLLKEKQEFRNYEFVDLDNYVFENHGNGHSNLSELIEHKGFEWFRHAEKAALLRLLEENEDIWIALGGGTLDEDLCDFLTLRSDVKGFWIKEPFDICWERIKNDPNRPLVALGEDKLREIFNNRLNIYKNFDLLQF